MQQTLKLENTYNILVHNHLGHPVRISWTPLSKQTKNEINLKVMNKANQSPKQSHIIEFTNIWKAAFKFEQAMKKIQSCEHT